LAVGWFRGLIFRCPACGELVRVKARYVRVLFLLSQGVWVGILVASGVRGLPLLLAILAGTLPVSWIGWPIANWIWPPPLEKHTPISMSILGKLNP
jgi:hypothetical protein